MLSIGEFSKICRVSAKTLRYYGEVGLLEPDAIDPENGYRYYSVGQLGRMLLISRLKSYGFSLSEIKSVLDDPGGVALRAALGRKRAEAERKVRDLEAVLGQMEADVSNLEKGGPIMAYFDAIEVRLIETAPANLLSDRRTMSGADYALGYGKYFERLYERIRTEKLTPAGSPMTIYHSPEYDPSGNDTEFAVPIEEKAAGTGRLPGRLCAKSVLKGPYAGLTSVYAKVREWIEKEGYEPADPPREVYLTDPDKAGSPEDLVTEVYFPVRKKRKGRM